MNTQERENYLKEQLKTFESKKYELEAKINVFANNAKHAKEKIKKIKSELEALEKSKEMPSFFIESIQRDDLIYKRSPEKFLQVTYIITFVSSGYAENFVNEARTGKDLLNDKLMEILKEVKL